MIRAAIRVRAPRTHLRDVSDVGHHHVMADVGPEWLGSAGAQGVHAQHARQHRHDEQHKQPPGGAAARSGAACHEDYRTAAVLRRDAHCGPPRPAFARLLGGRRGDRLRSPGPGHRRRVPAAAPRDQAHPVPDRRAVRSDIGTRCRGGHAGRPADPTPGADGRHSAGRRRNRGRRSRRVGAGADRGTGRDGDGHRHGEHGVDRSAAGPISSRRF